MLGEKPLDQARCSIGECARGDLNRARPTLVMAELASLSVE